MTQLPLVPNNRTHLNDLVVAEEIAQGQRPAGYWLLLNHCARSSSVRGKAMRLPCD
jgi:hypothetical protein